MNPSAKTNDKNTILNEVLTDFTSLYIQEINRTSSENRLQVLDLYNEAKKMGFSGLIYSELNQELFNNSTIGKINPFHSKYLKNDSYIEEACHALLSNLNKKSYFDNRFDSYLPKVLLLKQAIIKLMRENTNINILDVIDYIEKVDPSQIEKNVYLKEENIKTVLTSLIDDLNPLKEQSELILENYSSSSINLENLQEKEILYIKKRTEDLATNSIDAVIISIYARLNMKMSKNNSNKIIILDNLNLLVPDIDGWPPIARSCKFKLITISSSSKEESKQMMVFKANCNTIMVETAKPGTFEVQHRYKKEKNCIVDFN